MRWLVLYIVWGVYEQNSIVKKIPVDDWMAELAIIANNDAEKNYCGPVCRLAPPVCMFCIFLGWPKMQRFEI